MFRYRVIELRCFSQELGRHSKYGVLAEQKRRGSWIAKAVTAELPANREAVTALAEKWTTYQLDPIHLADVVADIFYEQCMEEEA